MLRFAKLISFACLWGAFSVALAAGEFETNVRPILEKYCWDCHADGANKGGVAFDTFKSQADLMSQKELWWKALKNVRAGLMPPPKKDQPEGTERQLIEDWIKEKVFELDPKDPDPGRVTVRRLNRIEYRNTIRDLMGIDFETDKEFPPDDAGHGFDNIGDALTLSPMLLEKYLAAAQSIVRKAVPQTSGTPAESYLVGKKPEEVQSSGRRRTSRTEDKPAVSYSFYEGKSTTHTINIANSGRFQISFQFSNVEKYVENQFDYNRCRLILRADGKELHNKEYSREGNRTHTLEFDQSWTAGMHEMVVEVLPVIPLKEQVRSLTLRLDALVVRGPMEPKFWVKPPNYDRYFPGPIPTRLASKRDYARSRLKDFALSAFRRPVDEKTLDRLMAIYEDSTRKQGKTFEAGISQAMVAVLASPRFLFREEGMLELRPDSKFPFIDEFALATRMSYFLWSSMPDADLMKLASKNQLRSQIETQWKRMLEDPKSDALVRNFVGQWLQTRDIETVNIDARQVLMRESGPDLDAQRKRSRLQSLRAKPENQLTPEENKEIDTLRAELNRRNNRFNRAELTGDLRRAMRQETELVFNRILRENRSLLELLDSDYTFLNERLARHYGLTNQPITGEQMRLVALPAGSNRGGVMTHGSVLTVTSNPTRTSPVKRGLFILENLLGTPPPPPPPDIPPLEEAAKAMRSKRLSLRETLSLHREQALCASCHNRMDPLGLALENFNALGLWREAEQGMPIDAAGQLVSGETFSSVKELQRILVQNHSKEFYHAVTEKLLTYALGRGVDYFDVATIDKIAARLEGAGGRPYDLLAGIFESAAFQRSRSSPKSSELSVDKSVRNK